MSTSSTPHPIGKDELRSKLIEMQKEMLDNAKPMQELTIRAIEEDWDDEKLQSEVLTLIKNKLLDLRKDYAYYADKVIELFDAYTIEAEKRAELRGRLAVQKKVQQVSVHINGELIVPSWLVKEWEAQLHNLNTKEGKA